MTVTSIRLQKDLEDPLATLAEQLQRSKNWLINRAVQEFLERRQLEEVRWRETLAALDSVRQGDVLPEEAIHNWLASWGQPDELEPPDG